MARQVIIVYHSDAADGRRAWGGPEVAITGVLPAHLRSLCRRIFGPDGPEMTCIDDGDDESGGFGVFKLPDTFASALSSSTRHRDRVSPESLAWQWCENGAGMPADVALSLIEHLLILTGKRKPDGVWYAMFCSVWPDNLLPIQTVRWEPWARI